MIKSFSEEDVHKAIKYGVWSSTKAGNETLNKVYRIAQERGGNVFLFFSVNGSGKFSGVCRMVSAVDYQKMFIYWTQDSKWGGMLDVEWIFIKDVPFKEFREVKFKMKDGTFKCVTNSRDIQEIPFTEAVTMVEKVEKYRHVTSILEHFEFYDVRQENYEKSNLMNSTKNVQVGMNDV